MILPFNTIDLEAIKDPRDRCLFIWDHYVSRKRNDDYEPDWVLKPYALVKKFIDLEENADLDEKEYFILNETIKSHLQEDGTEVPVKTGFPNEGSRIMHDCWKAGSFTWLFMGRADSNEVFYHKDFVVISRTLPDHLYSLLDREVFAPQTLFAAYKKADDSMNVGPAVSIDDLLQELENKKYV